MNILDEAATIIAGRNDDYGQPEHNLKRIAEMWTTYMAIDITPRDVSMMMILLKCPRDAHKEKRDNLVDIAGYAALADQLEDDVDDAGTEYGQAIVEGLKKRRNLRVWEDMRIGAKVKDKDGDIWEKSPEGWISDGFGPRDIELIRRQYGPLTVASVES